MSGQRVTRIRANRGDGSVVQVPTGKHAGKWRARLTYRDRWNRVQRTDKIFATQTEARSYLKRLRLDLEHGRDINDRSRTLGEWFDWLASNEWPSRIADSTLGARVSRFNRYTRAHLGDVPLSLIRPLMVREFYERAKHLGAGGHTLVEIRGDLVLAFNDALRFEIFDGSNPFALMRVDKPALREGIALEPEPAFESMRKLRLAVEQGRISGRDLLCVQIALFAGLRRGEIMALAEEQLDFKKNLISVDRAARVRRNGSQFIGLPKRNKKRKAALASHLAESIQAHLRTRSNGSTLLFPSAEGTPLMAKRFREHVDRAILVGEFPQNMTLRDFRLTHNNWIEKHMPDISDGVRLVHMGHSLIGVNLRHYTRDSEPAIQRLAESIDAFIRANH